MDSCCIKLEIELALDLARPSVNRVFPLHDLTHMSASETDSPLPDAVLGDGHLFWWSHPPGGSSPQNVKDLVCVSSCVALLCGCCGSVE